VPHRRSSPHATSSRRITKRSLRILPSFSALFARSCLCLAAPRDLPSGKLHFRLCCTLIKSPPDIPSLSANHVSRRNYLSIARARALFCSLIKSIRTWRPLRISQVPPSPPLPRHPVPPIQAGGRSGMENRTSKTESG